MQRSFHFGEIGPTLFGGADPRVYQNALAGCRNFIVMKHGGLANRSGLEFIAEVKDSSLKTWLFPFIFSDDDAYLIEVGHEYFRLFYDGEVVTVGTADAWTDTTPYLQGEVVSHSGDNYYCIADHTSASALDEPGAGSAWEDAWYLLTDDILEIPTPYQTEDLELLQWKQDGDLLTLTRRGYQPRELVRLADRWLLRAVSTAPSIDAPEMDSLDSLDDSSGSGGLLHYRYVVTAIKRETYEESLPSAPFEVAIHAEPTPDNPNIIAWEPVTGAVEYRVYLDAADNGTWGFVGIAGTTLFNDIGYPPNMAITPPIERILFEESGEEPACSTTYQQRRVFASSENQKQTAWTSRTGFLKNFSIRSPIQDDDAVTFTIFGRRMAEIRHVVEVGRLVLLTASGEHVCFGDAEGVLKPGAINQKQMSHYGSEWVMPVVVGNAIVFAQARAKAVRDLEFSDTVDGLQGKDLTLYAPHLLELETVERMDYQQNPHSIVWCVRSDGVLLGLTYLRDLQTFGWHRHDTVGGVFEEVRVIPGNKPMPPDVAVEPDESSEPSGPIGLAFGLGSAELWLLVPNTLTWVQLAIGTWTYDETSCLYFSPHDNSLFAAVYNSAAGNIALFQSDPDLTAVSAFTDQLVPSTTGRRFINSIVDTEDNRYLGLMTTGGQAENFLTSTKLLPTVWDTVPLPGGVATVYGVTALRPTGGANDEMLVALRVADYSDVRMYLWNSSTGYTDLSFPAAADCDWITFIEPTDDPDLYLVGNLMTGGFSSGIRPRLWTLKVSTGTWTVVGSSWSLNNASQGGAVWRARISGDVISAVVGWGISPRLEVWQASWTAGIVGSWSPIATGSIPFGNGTFYFLGDLDYDADGNLYAGIGGPIAGLGDGWKYDSGIWTQVGGDGLNGSWATNSSANCVIRCGT
jgi:hypothetical protein